MCDLNILGTRMETSVLFLEPRCDLYPILRDVLLRAALGQPISVVPCDVVVWGGLQIDRHLLLPASGQGPNRIHRTHQPRRVGSLERRLGDCASRCPWSPGVAN
jgi:hypothetical protein